MENPLFSIIIPTYNRASTIATTLQSLAEQFFTDFEVIVVDDGSTDSTREVVAPFLEDSRFAYYHKKNEERAIARNFGIDRARGQYLTFLDSDDAYYSNCLKEAHSFIKAAPATLFFHLGYEIKNGAGKILYRSSQEGQQLNHKLLSGNLLSCINVFVKQELLLQDRFHENPALIGSEDYELWLRLSAKYPLNYHPAIGAYMLQHDMRSVVNINKEKFNVRMQLLLDLVCSHSAIRAKYSAADLQVFRNHTMLYWSLHLAMAGYKKEALAVLMKVLAHAPSLFSSRKFLGIVKTLLLK